MINVLSKTKLSMFTGILNAEGSQSSFDTEA